MPRGPFGTVDLFVTHFPSFQKTAEGCAHPVLFFCLCLVVSYFGRPLSTFTALIVSHNNDFVPPFITVLMFDRNISVFVFQETRRVFEKRLKAPRLFFLEHSLLEPFEPVHFFVLIPILQGVPLAFHQQSQHGVHFLQGFLPRTPNLCTGHNQRRKHWVHKLCDSQILGSEYYQPSNNTTATTSNNGGRTGGLRRAPHITDTAKPHRNPIVQRSNIP